MKLFLVLLGLIISFPSFSFETGQHFFRINEHKGTDETAVRSYLSPDGKTTVQLIGLSHWAIPSFYKKIESLIKGKVVLYELAGSTLERQAKIHQRFKKLEHPYGNRYKKYFVQNFPDSLGRIDFLHNPA